MSPAPRFSLAALSLFIAVISGWAAYALPWRPWTLFSVLAIGLCVVHTVTAVLGILGHRARLPAWRVQSWVDLGFLAYATWNVLRSVVYVAVLYGSLGRGVGAALALVWVIAVALLLPGALWGLAVTGGVARRKKLATAAALVLAVGGDLLWVREAAAAEPVEAVAEHASGDIEQKLRDGLEGLPTPTTDEAVPMREPVTCAEPPGEQRVTIAASYAGPRGEPAGRCVQAATLDDAVAALRAVLEQSPARGPVKIDVVAGTQPLRALAPIVDALSLRPGLDGICVRAQCLLPWQLVAHDVFGAYKPIPVIHDLRFGVTPARLFAALGPPPGARELVRIETHSFVLHEGELADLHRLHRADEPTLDRSSLAAAVSAAQAYILASAGKDGRFAYRVDPFTGRAYYQGFSIPRQAGTTLALCELGDERVRPVVRAALEMLATTEQRSSDGEVGFLAYPVGRRPDVVDLGSTALSAIAFLSCRDLVGDAFDPLIARLVRFVAVMQREDGGFFARYDTRSDEPVPGPDTLYAAGQAVFALVLAEAVAEHDLAGELSHSAVRDAVQRAMDYVAEDYWDGFASDFFFLEENWHCLAARAALSHHRHAGYERFCRDYVRFKARLILESDVDADLRGGYGFGNVLPPHNTPTAGYGEALAAAMAIDAADGRRDERFESLMRQALTFLLRHQWDETSCFACARSRVIAGAWSEHIGSPTIRIDYVQHAMAALGHGGRAMGLR